MVILDTCVIIEHLRKQGSSSTLQRISTVKSVKSLYLSELSIQELYEGRSTKNAQKEEHLLALISPLKILSYNYEIAKLAGQLARDLKYPVGFADAGIAATAIINNCSLLTLNRKHFVNFKGLNLEETNLP